MVGNEITGEYFGSRDIPRRFGRTQYFNGEILCGTAGTTAWVEVHEQSLVWEYDTCEGCIVADSLHQSSTMLAYKLLQTVSNNLDSRKT